MDRVDKLEHRMNQLISEVNGMVSTVKTLSGCMEIILRDQKELRGLMSMFHDLEAAGSLLENSDDQG